jgi:hypothetical protein
MTEQTESQRLGSGFVAAMSEEPKDFEEALLKIDILRRFALNMIPTNRLFQRVCKNKFCVPIEQVYRLYEIDENFLIKRGIFFYTEKGQLLVDKSYSNDGWFDTLIISRLSDKPELKDPMSLEIIVMERGLDMLVKLLEDETLDPRALLGIKLDNGLSVPKE